LRARGLANPLIWRVLTVARERQLPIPALDPWVSSLAPFRFRTAAGPAAQAAVSNSNLRWLHVPDLNLSTDCVARLIPSIADLITAGKAHRREPKLPIARLLCPSLLGEAATSFVFDYRQIIEIAYQCHWRAERVERPIPAARASAMPSSIGCSLVELQRQPPLSTFSDAKTFSIPIRCGWSHRAHKKARLSRANSATLGGKTRPDGETSCAG
jgi:hypothetical protein